MLDQGRFFHAEFQVAGHRRRQLIELDLAQRHRPRRDIRLRRHQLDVLDNGLQLSVSKPDLVLRRECHAKPGLQVRQLESAKLDQEFLVAPLFNGDLRVSAAQVEQSLDYVRRKPLVVGVMHEDPAVEVLLPVRLGTGEILLDLRHRFRRGNLIGRIDLKQRARRRQIAVVLPVALSPPRPAGHEVAGIALAHHGFEEMLEGITSRLKESNPEILLVAQLLDSIHCGSGTKDGK